VSAYKFAHSNTAGLVCHPPYSPDLVPSDHHLFTYLKNWLGLQQFNNNVLMEGVKPWLSSQVADFYDTGTQKLFPYTTNASVPAVTMSRGSLSMYDFVYNNILLSLVLLNKYRMFHFPYIYSMFNVLIGF
jgi:hypothetical protein